MHMCIAWLYRFESQLTNSTLTNLKNFIIYCTCQKFHSSLSDVAHNRLPQFLKKTVQVQGGNITLRFFLEQQFLDVKVMWELLKMIKFLFNKTWAQANKTLKTPRRKYTSQSWSHSQYAQWNIMRINYVNPILHTVFQHHILQERAYLSLNYF